MRDFAIVVLAVLIFHAGNSLCSDFDPETHHAAPPATNDWQGREDTLAGLDVYVNGFPSSSAAVILISDVFGWKAPLFRKLADKVAKDGYYVVAPDYFRGDLLVNTSDIAKWRLKHPQAAEVETTNKLAIALKAQGQSYVGLAGFCWGGKVAILTVKTKGLVNAIVQLHPGSVTASDYEQVAVPASVLAAPTDGVQNFTSILHRRKKEVKSYVKIFTQVQHGWTVRYNETDKQAVKKANRAHVLMLKWFHKYLK